MYTVCWTNDDNRNGNGSVGCDKWERCESRREVAALLIRERLENDGDVLIFGPDAEDYLVSVEDLFKDL